MAPLIIMGAFLTLFITSGDGTSSSSLSGSTLQANAVVEDPEFTNVIDNITVTAGRNVKLSCSVKNLGSYKVAWMHFEQSAILTVHNHVITRNPRVSVTFDRHDNHKTFFLHINNVQEEDKGRYMCQINTVAAKTQFGYLRVVVPPDIDDSITSNDVIVREGANVTLKCSATGSPAPTVSWRREDSKKIPINKGENVTSFIGETLELTRISRLDMGAYLCVAHNGVPPSVSKRIRVSVDFPPMLSIPHQLVGIPVSYNVSLECFVEAHPVSLNYWTFNNGPMLHDSSKYISSVISRTSYSSIMRLSIYNVQQSDYGPYKCIAKNPRGETDGTIRLYSSSPPTTQPPPTTETLSKEQPILNEVNIDNIIKANNNNAIVNNHNNDTTYGQTSTYSVHLSDKGSKYQSNLNEIDRSEHKSSGDSPKGFDWPPDEKQSNGYSSAISHHSRHQYYYNYNINNNYNKNRYFSIKQQIFFIKYLLIICCLSLCLLHVHYYHQIIYQQ